MNVYANGSVFIAVVFFFLDLACMLLNWGQVTNFTIVGGTAKHYVDQYNGFVSLLFARGRATC